MTNPNSTEGAPGETGDTSGVQASVPTQRQKDLALLVKLLCRRLRPHDTLRKGATDYLRREGLLGSPLRADDSGVTPCRAEQRGASEWVCDCEKPGPNCKPTGWRAEVPRG